MKWRNENEGYTLAKAKKRILLHLLLITIVLLTQVPLVFVLALFRRISVKLVRVDMKVEYDLSDTESVFRGFCLATSSD